MSLTTLWHLAVTLGLGLLVGLERERAGKEVGLRTFSFVSLLGFLSWNLGLLFTLSTLVFVAVIVVVINVRAIQKDISVEATTSVSLFLIALVGMMVAQGNIVMPVAVVILMLALLSWKEEMVGFTRHLRRSEIQAAITLGILSFVILPALPAGPLDPWGLFDVRRIWLMVVLISAIGFANYILLKLYGSKGMNYTGFLGGLVNSTATVAELAKTARQEYGVEGAVFRGMMLAKTASFLRNAVILALFAPAALPAGLVPISMMILTTLYFAIRPGGIGHSSSPPELEIESPFSLRAALIFGSFVAGITLLGAVGQLLGNLGFYVVAFFGGIVSSSSTVATAAHMAATDRITPIVAGSAVVISSIASALVILPIVWKGSNKPLLNKRVITAVAWVIAVSTIGIVLNPYILQQFEAVQAWVGS